jgi:hypothetical protein
MDYLLTLSVDKIMYSRITVWEIVNSKGRKESSRSLI